jgi:glycosyltransferase involved in cell wall biosynthesis
MKWLLLDDSKGTNQVNTTILLLEDQLSKTEGVDQVGMFNTIQNGRLLSEDAVGKEIAAFHPDVILWQSVVGLRYYNTISSFLNAKKINLWFDDPIQRIEVGNHSKEMALSRFNVNHFIWDGYWLKRVEQEYLLKAHPIHLAASPDQYLTADTLYHPDDVVFFGNLHSPRDIAHQIDALPPAMLKIAREAQSFIKNHPINATIPPWDKLLRDIEKTLSRGDRLLLQGEANQPGHGRAMLSQLRWCVWALSKNEIRVRILKRALKVNSVRMFAEMKQYHHANESEIRGLLDCWGTRLNVHETSGISSEQLFHIQHHGFLHINATDPQSVQGGVPYRLFETAACARPLLTDTRPDYAECFEYEKEILTYQNEDDFEFALLNAISLKKDLPEVGRAARKRLLKDHTWENRVNQIKKACGLEVVNFGQLEINSAVQEAQEELAALAEKMTDPESILEPLNLFYAGAK